MKLHGKTISPPKPKRFTIREVEFTVGPVLDFEEFDRLVPEPKVPLVRKKVGRGWSKRRDPDSQDYRDAMERYGDLRSSYIVLYSLAFTEGLEWDTVDLQDPKTWENYKKELTESFTAAEIGMIINEAFTVNMPDEEEAVGNFSSEQREEENPESTERDELKSTESGEPAND
jgi:hypothetical protein